MKRQRSTFDEEQPTNKIFDLQHRLDGPFCDPIAQVWIDFWKHDLLPLSSQRNLFRLSCCSRALYSLVWTHLIPISGILLDYVDPDDFELIAKYFCQVPLLESLNLKRFISEEGMTLLTHLHNLRELKLPFWIFRPIPFPWEEIKHLTDLVKLTAEFNKVPESCDLNAFPKLKELTAICPTSDFTAKINAGPPLEFLELEDVCGQVQPLDRLTSLTHLKISTDKTPPRNIGLRLMTKLTHLSLDSPRHFANPNDLMALTNLKSLKGSAIDHDEMFQKVLLAIPALTCLHLCRESRHIRPEQQENFRFISLLTNLTDLKLNAESCGDNIRYLPASLQSLTIASVPERIPEPVPPLPNLRKLKVDSAKFLVLAQGLTSLTKLSWYNAHHNDFPVLLEKLTNITSLSLRHSQETDELVDRFTDIMTGLKSLDLKYTDITSDSIHYIAALLTQLEVLDLSDCTDLMNENPEDSIEDEEEGPQDNWNRLLEPLWGLNSLKHVEFYQQRSTAPFWRYHLRYQEDPQLDSDLESSE